MKIFIGMYNIASLMYDYATGFRALGHDVFTVSMVDSTICYNDSIDINFPRHVASLALQQDQVSQHIAETKYQNLLSLAWQKACEADICFFIWGSFRPDASDLAQLHQMGKKIIVRFCGSEVRDMEVQRQMAAYYNQRYTSYSLMETLALERNLRWLRYAERFSDLLLASSAMSLRPCNGRGVCLFQPMSDLCNVQQRQHPVLLHAPSTTQTKGTNEWLQIFDALRNEGLSFGVKLVQGIPNKEMPQEYASADIFCNSLYYGGRASWEALAAGTIAVGSQNAAFSRRLWQEMDDRLTPEGHHLGQSEKEDLWRSAGYAEIYDELPVIDMDASNAKDRLAELIKDYPRRQALAEKGPVYVRNVLSPSVVCQKILDTLFAPEEERENRCFWPSFFRHHYDASNDSPERKALFNKYTRLVRHERWYRRFVPQGERHGLIF